MPMKQVIVTIKRVPDPESGVCIKSNAKGICTEGIAWIVNPFDEIALEEALRIKESRSDVEIIVVSIGVSAAIEQLRTCLALGADRGVLVECNQDVDSFGVAKMISALVQRDDIFHNVWLILMGKQAIDSDAHQTGALVAGFLGVSQATCVSKLNIDTLGETAQVHREVDYGLEVSRISLPAVITSDLRLNEPRYATLMGIMRASREQIKCVHYNELGLEETCATVVHRMIRIGKRRERIECHSADQLARVLSDFIE